MAKKKERETGSLLRRPPKRSKKRRRKEVLRLTPYHHLPRFPPPPLSIPRLFPQYPVISDWNSAAEITLISRSDTVSSWPCTLRVLTSDSPFSSRNPRTRHPPRRLCRFHDSVTCAGPGTVQARPVRIRLRGSPPLVPASKRRHMFPCVRVSTGNDNGDGGVVGTAHNPQLHNPVS